MKFMIEGEEEVGSDNLPIFVKEYRDKLKADVILISDTAFLSLDQPSITVGLRGLSYMEVEVTARTVIFIQVCMVAPSPIRSMNSAR